MADLINPLGPKAVLTRGFYFPSSIYFGGRHYAGDYALPWPLQTRGAPIIAAGHGQAMASPYFDATRGLFVMAQTGTWRIGVAHLLAFNIPVNVWVPVRQGDVLGWADNTGLSAGDHAHVDCWNTQRMSAEAVLKMGYYAHDPEIWLAKEPPEEDDMPREILAVTGVHGGYTFVLTDAGTLRYIKSENEREYLKAHGYSVRIESDGRSMDLLDSENLVSLKANLAAGRYG